MSIREWLKNRKSIRRENRITEGFGWAMTAYYREGKSINELNDILDAARHLNDFKDFDTGIFEATLVIDYNERQLNSYQVNSNTDEN